MIIRSRLTAQHLTGTLPGLTGLRGVAVLLVVVGHTIYARYPEGLGVEAVNAAGLGVQAFFVLSGFLITTLLLRERDHTGGISLRKFYMRRMLRLWPPLYLFLAGMAIFGTIGASAVTRGDLIAASLHMFNYSGIRTSALQHTWSLAVEEHFYLLFPPAFVFLSRRALVNACAALVILSPVIRMAAFVLAPDSRDLASHMTHNRLDALLIGCLLALCWQNSWLQAVLRFALRPSMLILVIVVLIETVHAETLWQGRFVFPMGYGLQAVLVAVLIGGMQLEGTWLRRFLAHRLLMRVGVISFSVYLWQQFFTVSAVDHWWNVLPIALIGPFFAGEISYRLIETPMANVRRKFH